MSSLEKCLFRSLAHFKIGCFVFLVLSHMHSLYILEIKSLSDVSLANIFSHRVGSLFILIMFFFACAKAFYFDVIPFGFVCLFVFCFYFPWPRRYVKCWKQTECPTVDGWVKKLWYIHTMEYYAAERKKELLHLVTAWVELENVMLSEISRSVKDILYDLIYKRNLMNKIN